MSLNISISPVRSVLEGRGVYHARKGDRAELARESGVNADIVIPVPDSGVPAALGFAEASGIPFELGIIRNHYIGRTFIQPTQEGRTDSVKLKHNANPEAVHGKRVVLVDDSIVRGTTSRKIVNMMRAAGAAEVHLRIASPPTKSPCFYGVDTPDQDQLIAAKMTTDQVAKDIDADSLAFISIDGLYRALGEAGRETASPQFCDACFTDYPIARKWTAANASHMAAAPGVNQVTDELRVWMASWFWLPEQSRHWPGCCRCRRRRWRRTVDNRKNNWRTRGGG